MGIKGGVNTSIMTLEEFKKRMLKEIDGDKDGKISKDELSAAVRRHGGWFASWKAKWGVWSADSNGNGFVDDSEIRNLVDFAHKNLGIKIIFWYCMCLLYCHSVIMVPLYCRCVIKRKTE